MEERVSIIPDVVYRIIDDLHSWLHANNNRISHFPLFLYCFSPVTPVQT